jgi:hypothetical protein
MYAELNPEELSANDEAVAAEFDAQRQAMTEEVVRLGATVLN